MRVWGFLYIWGFLAEQMRTKGLGFSFIGVIFVLFLLTTCGSKEKEGKVVVPQPSGTTMHTSPPMPDTVSFLGEKVPLERFEVYECLEREMLVNSYFHSQTIRFLKLAPRFFSLVDPILKEEGLPSDFRYLMVAESNLNPKALSPAGAAGLWQFMKPAAIQYGLEVNAEVDERYHIEKSTRAACQYLKAAFKKYGSWGLVAAGYNAGPGAVDKQLLRQKVNNYFDLLMSEETERYVFRIISLKLILENPAKYGFDVPEEEKYPLWKTKKIEVSGAVPDWAAFATQQGITYKTLKYYNPWLRDYFLTNKLKKSYQVLIPVQ